MRDTVAARRQPRDASPLTVLVADLGVASRIRDLLGHERARCVSVESVSENDEPPVLLATATPIPWAVVGRMALASAGLIVVVDQHDDDDEYRAIECGAAGYISMGMSRAAIDGAIAGVKRSEPAFTRRALGKWLRSQQPGVWHRARLATLPDRQREIVVLIGEGKTDREIAAALGIAVTTVHKHVSKLLKRLGAPNRAAAVAYLGAHQARRSDPRGTPARHAR